MTKGLVFTANDFSSGLSTMISLFGSPHDYVQKLSKSNTNLPMYSSYERWKFSYDYDRYHAVALDVQRGKVYYGNNAHGRVEYADSLNYAITTKFSYYNSPPITKQVTSPLFCNLIGTHLHSHAVSY